MPQRRPDADIRALVVDPRHLSRRILAAMLRHLGAVEVVEVADSADGVEILDRDPAIGIIFVDVDGCLSDAEGRLISLRAARPPGTAVLVAVGGDISANALLVFARAGADGILRKPLSIYDVRQVVSARTSPASEADPLDVIAAPRPESEAA